MGHIDEPYVRQQPWNVDGVEMLSAGKAVVGVNGFPVIEDRADLWMAILEEGMRNGVGWSLEW